MPWHILIQQLYGNLLHMFRQQQDVNKSHYFPSPEVFADCLTDKVHVLLVMTDQALIFLSLGKCHPVILR